MTQDRLLGQSRTVHIRCTALPIRETTLDWDRMTGALGGQGATEDLAGMQEALGAGKTMAQPTPHYQYLKLTNETAMWGVGSVNNHEPDRSSLQTVLKEAAALPGRAWNALSDYASGLWAEVRIPSTRQWAQWAQGR